jgi:hypothetical protein
MAFDKITEAESRKSMREYSRVEVSWPVILHTAEGLIDGKLENASVEGALIHCQRPIDVSQLLEVSIEIPGSVLPVLATVEVIRSNTREKGDASPSCQLAVRFLEMSEEGRRIFCGAIERQARTRNPRPVAQEKVSIALQAELLKVVDALSAELERPSHDLVEEAIEDLVKKYAGRPMTDRLESKLDQRQNDRVEVSWPVVVKTLNKSIKGKVKNISSRGALVCCHELPCSDFDKPFQLQIKIPEHNYIFSVPAKLVRFDIDDSGSAFFRYSMAFLFLEVSKDDLLFLSNKLLYGRA